MSNMLKFQMIPKKLQLQLHCEKRLVDLETLFESDLTTTRWLGAPIVSQNSTPCCFIVGVLLSIF